MPDLGTVLDTEVVDEVIEQPVDDVVQDDGVEEVAAKPVEDVKGDERTMPQWMRELKANNPQAFKEAKGLFFGKRSIDEKLKDFDLDGTKSWLTEVGGREAIQTQVTELQTKAQQLDDIQAKLESDPVALVNDISPENVAKIGPAVLDIWSKTEPEVWGAAMSGIMAATIQQNGIPQFLDKMALYLEVGKTEAIPAMLKQLQEWAGNFTAKAQAAPQRPAPKDQGPTVQQERQTWEQEKFISGVRSEVESARSSEILKELDSFIKRKPADSDAKELAVNTIQSQVVERMSKDDAYQKSLNALIARKDKAGATQLAKSRESAAIREIAPKVGRTIYGQTVATKVEAPKAPVLTATVTAQKDPFKDIFNRAMNR